MIISISTMYVIPFPGIVGGGIPVNLDIESPRIIDLKRITNLEDVEIYVALGHFFSRLDSLFSYNKALALKSELLKYIHNEIPYLNSKLLDFIKGTYHRLEKDTTEDALRVKSIPLSFWGAV